MAFSITSLRCPAFQVIWSSKLNPCIALQNLSLFPCFLSPSFQWSRPELSWLTYLSSSSAVSPCHQLLWTVESSPWHFSSWTPPFIAIFRLRCSCQALISSPWNSCSGSLSTACFYSPLVSTSIHHSQTVLPKAQPGSCYSAKNKTCSF